MGGWLWQPGCPPPTARCGVLGARLRRSETRQDKGWKPPKRGVTLGKRAPTVIQAVQLEVRPIFGLGTVAPQTAIHGPRQAQMGVGQSPAAAPRLCAMRAQLATKRRGPRPRTPRRVPAPFGAVFWAVWLRFGPVFRGGTAPVGATAARNGGRGRPEPKTGFRGGHHWGRPTPKFQARAGAGAGVEADSDV